MQRNYANICKHGSKIGSKGKNNSRKRQGISGSKPRCFLCFVFRFSQSIEPLKSEDDHMPPFRRGINPPLQGKTSPPTEVGSAPSEDLFLQLQVFKDCLSSSCGASTEMEQDIFRGKSRCNIFWCNECKGTISN